MAPPPPHLMEELVEEILLRLPPDDPASLVHAALVCKLWCRLVCGAAFRRRFREFHRRAHPMLGLLYGGSCDIRRDDDEVTASGVVPKAYFVPTTTSFRPVHAADGGHYGCHAIDARHGRVLLRRKDSRLRDSHGGLCVVWDPVTDEKRVLPEPPLDLQIAAVACAATAGGNNCDHLDCRRGPFLVVAMAIQYDGMLHLSVYSSEAGAWSKVTVCEGPAANWDIYYVYNDVPGVLVRTALYILVHYDHETFVNDEIKVTVNHEIVKYDVAKRQLSMVRLPSKFRQWDGSVVVMTGDDGGLGFVVNVKNKLQLWSKMAGTDGDDDAGFVLTRAIDLWKVLPSAGELIKKKTQPQVIGFADGGEDSRVLFIRIYSYGLYGIEINSSQVTRVAHSCGYGEVVPYISFCTPTSRLQV